jgi:stage III sporulation protein AB
MKELGCILIMATCTVGGFTYARLWVNRVSTLKELHRILVQLQTEIEFTHTTLPEAFLILSKKAKEPIKSILYDTWDKLSVYGSESVYDAFKESIEKNKDSIGQAINDMDIVLDLAKSLGESDLAGQKRVISLAEYNLKKQIESIEVQTKKNVKMYRYLGFSFGAIIAILLI